MLTTNGPFAVVVSDMCMPEMHAIQFLTKARELAPTTVGIMLAGNNDLETTLEAVNQGEIFLFLTKPYPPSTMVLGLGAEIKQCQLIRSQFEMRSGKVCDIMWRGGTIYNGKNFTS